MSDDNGDVGSLFRLSGARAKRALREMGLPIPTPVRVAYHPDYALSFRFGGPRHALDGRRPARIYNRLWEVRLGSRQVQNRLPDLRDSTTRICYASSRIMLKYLRTS